MMDDTREKEIQPIRRVFCDKCDADITEAFSHPETFCKATRNEYEVEYVRCTKCGTTYQIFTTNPQMQELIKKRISIEKRIKDAFDRRLKQSTIRAYIQQHDRIIAEQKRLNAELHPIGDSIIAEREGR